VFELFVGQANVIENNRFAIGEIMRIAADDIVYGEVLEWHFHIPSSVCVPNNKWFDKLTTLSQVEG
jgi:hypothetical protein